MRSVASRRWPRSPAGSGPSSHPDGVLAVARDELHRALQLDRTTIELGDEPADGTPIVAHGERIGSLLIERARPLDAGELFLVDTVADEIGASLQTASLLAENQRRLEQQTALLHAAQVVTSELDLDSVLKLLVEQVTNLLDADAADCYLLDRERGVLRCAAVHGFAQELVGFEFTPAQGVAGAALREARPVVAEDYAAVAEPIPHPAYTGFSRALVAPMVWAGETRGVLGVGVRDATRSFTAPDIEMLEAFASLASLALRNAESFADPSRQARVQRGFYRIATLLGEPLSLAETYDAAAQAAAEALGGDCAAVLVKAGAGLRFVGGHELPDAVRSLELPPALLEAARDGQMLAATAVRDDDRFDASWRNGPFASLLAIPVPGEGSGIVLVLFREPREFARDDLELAQQVAGAARGALDRSRLFEAERTARSLSQQLARTGQPARDRARPGRGARRGGRGGDGAARRRRCGAGRARGRRARRHRRRRGECRAGTRRSFDVDRLGRGQRRAVARPRRLRGRCGRREPARSRTFCSRPGIAPSSACR